MTGDKEQRDKKKGTDGGAAAGLSESEQILLLTAQKKVLLAQRNIQTLLVQHGEMLKHLQAAEREYGSMKLEMEKKHGGKINEETLGLEIHREA